MIKVEKREKLSILKEEIETSKSLILIDFTGIKVEHVNSLRREAKKSGIKYYVVKNTLLKKAVENTKYEGIMKFLTGPTAIAMSDEDPVIPAKLINDFSRKNKVLAIKGGFLGKDVLGVNDVKRLADLPSKEDLIARTVFLIASPIAKFVNVLCNPIRNFITVLSLLEKQKSKKNNGG